MLKCHCVNLIFLLIYLVPPDATDEMAGAINFGEEFSNRYGTGYPAFYPGSLDDAIKDSCLKPARDVSSSCFIYLRVRPYTTCPTDVTNPTMRQTFIHAC